MTSKFKILFSVELLNEYYTANKCTDFSIIPSPETALLLKKQQMLYKIIENKLLLLVKTDTDDKPLVNLDKDKKFVFYQQLDKPLFMTVTNLDQSLFSSKRFYFSNCAGNEQDGILYLTAPLNLYTDTAGYSLGSFVVSPSGVAFEALQKKSAGAAHDTADALFWVNKGKFQYASEQDMIQFVPMLYTYPVASAKLFDVRIYALDTVNNTYTRLIKNFNVSFDEAVSSLQVNLNEFVPGKYRLLINNNEFLVYADNNNVYSNNLGVIEIFCHPDSTSAFSLLDATGKVKDKKVGGKPVWLNYVIRFANRRAIWKYITKAGTLPGEPKINLIRVTGSADPSGLVFAAFSNDPVGSPSRKDYFESKIPFALTEAREENNFEIDFTDISFTSVPAPKPSLLLSGMMTRPVADKYFYCNIFLNY